MLSPPQPLEPLPQPPKRRDSKRNPHKHLLDRASGSSCHAYQHALAPGPLRHPHRVRSCFRPGRCPRGGPCFRQARDGSALCAPGRTPRGMRCLDAGAVPPCPTAPVRARPAIRSLCLFDFAPPESTLPGSEGRRAAGVHPCGSSKEDPQMARARAARAGGRVLIGICAPHRCRSSLMPRPASTSPRGPSRTR